MSVSLSGHPLDGFTSPEPLLVIGDDASAADLAPAGATFTTMAGTTDIGRGWKSVLWMTSDRASLRRLASTISRVGQTRVVALWLTDATEPLVLVPRPEWPPLTSLMAREADRGVLTVLRFAQPIGAHVVLTELARQAVPGVDTGHGGAVVAYAGREPAAGLDVRAQRFDDAAEAGDDEIVVPADVVVTATTPHRRSTPSSTAHRPSSPTPASSPSTRWSSTPAAGARSGPSRSATSPPTRRSPRPRSRRCATYRDCAWTSPRPTRGPSPTSPPPAYPSSPPAPSPRSARRCSEALAHEPDLDDALAREEHSVTTRRAALLEHSTVAWRAGWPRAPASGTWRGPQVSVLLTTMRPHQLDFALRQLARQRDADFELVLATHGWEADEAEVRAALPGRESCCPAQPGHVLR